MLRFYTGCFGTWWMLSRACGEQPGTQPQGFAPSVLPCKGNPSFGICLLFLLRNTAKKGNGEIFPWGKNFWKERAKISLLVY